MPKSESTISIDAPIEAVFDAIADQNKVAKYTSASILTGVKGKPDELGGSGDWEYHVIGLKFKATVTVSEVDKPNKLVQQMTGSMPGKWIWVLKQDGEGTTVDFCIEYDLPGGILGRMANQLFLGRMNQKNVEKTLQGLKAYCEQQ